MSEQLTSHDIRLRLRDEQDAVESLQSVVALADGDAQNLYDSCKTYQVC